MAPVLPNRKIAKFFTTSGDQRERVETNRATARIGWRSCRPWKKQTVLVSVCERTQVEIGVAVEHLDFSETHAVHEMPLQQVGSGVCGLCKGLAGVRVVPSDELLQGRREMFILHEGGVYRLLRTKNNKLILQK
jgi:hypothetical protein